MGRVKSFWCNKILPLVYDASLSYYEVLGKVVDKINEIIDNLENVDVDKIDKAISDSQEAITVANSVAGTAQNAVVVAGAASAVANSAKETAESIADDIPTKTSELINDSGFVNQTQAESAAPVQSVNGNTGNVLIEVPTKTSDLNNDSGFVNQAQAASAAPVQSVNGDTGNVLIEVPTKTSDLNNDSGFTTRSDILAWGNVTNTDTLAQAQAKLITTPGYLRTWMYGSSAAYCPSSNNCVFTAYCKDSSIDYLYFSAVDTVTGNVYIADKAGVWHKQISYDDAYLITRDYIDYSIAVTGNNYVEHYIDNISVSGYTPLGVVGTRIGGSVRCCLYYTNLSTPVSGKYTRVLIGVRNIMSDAQTISCGCTVLYRKDA